mgnify:CR=1 FL=1
MSKMSELSLKNSYFVPKLLININWHVIIGKSSLIKSTGNVSAIRILSDPNLKNSYKQNFFPLSHHSSRK